MNVHFSSETSEWSTPQYFFNKYNEIYNFDLDVCATHENAKCRKYYTKEDDALKQVWSGSCWMNPPYGRGIGEWIKKAYESSLSGATVVCLIPSRTDTKWWHEYVMTGDIEFIKGRLKFGNAQNSAPFPSAVVVFGKKHIDNSFTIPYDEITIIVNSMEDLEEENPYYYNRLFDLMENFRKISYKSVDVKVTPLHY